MKENLLEVAKELLEMVTQQHNVLSHSFIKDEKACKKCKRVAKIKRFLQEESSKEIANDNG